MPILIHSTSRFPKLLLFRPVLSFQVDTDKRFQRFAECALPLATEVSKRAMTDVGVRPTDIGRIVVVTSTGVCGPGLDGELVRSIGLHHSVEREVVSFQGCGAGINGLRLACQVRTWSMADRVVSLFLAYESWFKWCYMLLSYVEILLVFSRGRDVSVVFRDSPRGLNIPKDCHVDRVRMRLTAIPPGIFIFGFCFSLCRGTLL